MEKELIKLMDEKLEEYNNKLLALNDNFFKVYNHENELHNLSVDFIATRYIDLNAEQIAEKYYNRKGFETIKLTSFDSLYKLPDFLKNVVSFIVQEGLKGCPDYICYDATGKTKHFFFVEVKATNDTLKQNQFLWIYKHPQFKVKLLFINEVISK